MSENTISSFDMKSKSVSSQVQKENLHTQRPFYDVLEDVKRQIEFDFFDMHDRHQADEIAKIIAEVYKLPKNSNVRIDGTDFSADMVAEVFGNISHEHVEEVIRHFNKANYEIKHIRKYLRTALYNSVFEMQSRLSNEVKKDTYGK